MSKYAISSILRISISKFEIGSASLTLISIAGSFSFSHVDKSDQILLRGPTNCFPHLKINMQILHPENFTMTLLPLKPIL